MLIERLRMKVSLQRALEGGRRWAATDRASVGLLQAAGARCCVRATKARSCVRPPSVVRGIAGIMRPALEALGQELELE